MQSSVASEESKSQCLQFQLNFYDFISGAKGELKTLNLYNVILENFRGNLKY